MLKTLRAVLGIQLITIKFPRFAFFRHPEHCCIMENTPLSEASMAPTLLQSSPVHKAITSPSSLLQGKGAKPNKSHTYVHIPKHTQADFFIQREHAGCCRR